MPIKLMLFCMLISPALLADDGDKVLNGYDPKVDIISDKYEAGPYLIYDCQDQHYVCVLESYAKVCDEKRAQDIHDKKVSLSCATLAVMPNKKSCFQKQLFMASQNHGNKFCVHEEWKQKEIDL